MSTADREAAHPVFRPQQADPKLYSVCIVAEIGTGHGGDIDHARALIDAAKEAGADCAKFQMVYADEIVHPRTGPVELPGGSVSLYDRFRAVEQDERFYQEIKEYCEQQGLLFLCTAFGEQSAAALTRLGVQAYKVASPELNHLPLLRQLREQAKPIALSSGVSSLGDIERALSITGRDLSQLLHCVTSYPAPEEEYNLRVLEGLSRIFGVSVGVSDHSEDPELVPALAVSLGANMVEKHFTLSREGGGLDDPIALEPVAFRRMSATIRRVEEILRIGGGDGPPRIREEFREAYGSQRVDAVLGDGVKRLAPSEARYYGRTNRSIHARAEIPSGHVIRHEDVALLRTEQNLTPGLPPEFLEEVIGTRVSRTIPAGEGVRLRDLACPGN